MVASPLSPFMLLAFYSNGPGVAVAFVVPRLPLLQLTLPVVALSSLLLRLVVSK